MNATAIGSPLMLNAETAADLMVSNPVSLSVDATLHEAIVLFTNKGFRAAPVIDAAGQPVGVVSLSDIINHDRARIEWGSAYVSSFDSEQPANGEAQAKARTNDADATRVGELMTPAVFSVSPDTPAAKVVQEMLALRVHRLFVVDGDGALVGVISSHDILRRLSA